MSEVADDAPPSIEELDRYRRAGWALVAPNEFDVPVAYLLAEPVDGALHIEQVSVHTDFSRRGLGGRLIEKAAECAVANSYDGLTLTTFVEVPWNAPYYRRLGFVELRVENVTPGLAAIRRKEADLGLDRWPRICMRKELSAYCETDYLHRKPTKA
ncbi:GNAT family N-acetyltransferase [Nesterenkonia ebinurensis]|uniref:GNAT family N-acetyltransferase n=1 Tax=Nesterenkonia ebinurensis TaxID=2608252 RepID=UPI00123C97CA|nr:GNAT family N-acetyltransferase [Nesterenkonia ebinurensis]